MQDGPSPPPTPRTAQKSSSIYQHREASAQVTPGQGAQRRVGGGGLCFRGPPGAEASQDGPFPLPKGSSC